MPRTRSLAWSELKIGILAIAALTAAATLIFLLGGQGGFFWQRYYLKARFANVATLKPGSPVRVAGMEVGSVDSVELAGAGVEIVMQLANRVQDRVRTKSVASIGSVSLLGEGSVDITASLEGTPVPEWGYVQAARGPGQLADAIEQSTRSLEQAELLIADIRKGKGTVGKLVVDEGLYRDLQSFASAADRVTQTIARGDGSLGRLVNNPTTARELETSLRNLSSITQRMTSGEGSLGRLLNDEAFAKSLTATTTNTEAVTGKLARGEGTAGKLIHDAALYNRLDSVSAKLDDLLTQLNQGQGTAGQLLRDRRLYDSLTETVAEIRGLVSDIRKDPRKYLNVKVSIF